MAVYKSLYTKIWLDGRFKKLSADSKLLFIYLGWHPNISITGIYEIDLDVARLQLKLSKDIFECLEELTKAGMLLFDYDYSYVFIKNHFKYLPKGSPFVLKGAIIELRQIRHLFKNDFIELYKVELREYFDRKFEKQEVHARDTNVNYLEPANLDMLKKVYVTEPDRLKKFLLNKGYSTDQIEVALR